MSNRNYKLRDLAARVDAQIRGDQDKTIVGVAKLEYAKANQLAFCTGNRYLDQLRTTGAGAVLVKEELADQCPVTAMIVADPYYAYAELATLLHPYPRSTPRVDPSARVADDVIVEKGVSIGPGVVVSSGAHLGKNCVIGAGTYIGTQVKLGEDTRLAPGVHIGDGCTLGARVILHAGAVIGADGFGFAPGQGGWLKVPQLGIVRIGDDVEIGANSTIDRGALEDTIIEHGVKIDNLVHIAHNVLVGANTVIAGCTVIAGSSSIGKNCVIGGQSAITGHIEICDGVTIMGMTGVTHSIREAGVYSSPIPARPVKSWRKNVVRFMQLDEIFRRLKEVEQHMERRKTSRTDA